MINFDDVTKENIKEHNPNWPQIPDHPYRILIIGGSGSGKTNSLFNLINHQPNIDKIYLYAKDLYEAKYALVSRWFQLQYDQYFLSFSYFADLFHEPLGE